MTTLLLVHRSGRPLSYGYLYQRLWPESEAVNIARLHPLEQAVEEVDQSRRWAISS